MRVQNVRVSNFRLLCNVELDLETGTTLVVGRNNSGKTSLTELFRRLMSDRLPQFGLEDFSLPVHDGFWVAFNQWRGSRSLEAVVAALPEIRIELTISYDGDGETVADLTDFIVDLDVDCTVARVVMTYALIPGRIDSFFQGLDVVQETEEAEQKTTFFRQLKERLPRSYHSTIVAVDPGDNENRKELEMASFRRLVQCGFINAQRALDDSTGSGAEVLGKVLGAIFKSASSTAADQGDQAAARTLASAVQALENEINDEFNRQLDELIPTFETFGYPGLQDPKLRTQTNLDAANLLKSDTEVLYTGAHGVHLPEAYNGLGPRNLIFILLKLLEFFKDYRSRIPMPGLHLIFIEEPEAHLHPQMQEVFIQQIERIADAFSATYNGGARWPVQFIVSTHSSHMANRAHFDSIRYFIAAPSPGSTACSTTVKNLRSGIKRGPDFDEEFLHKYLTLTRCDLFFADKAILIEGTSERLLLPKMIRMLDYECDGLELSSQYIATMEVGGAYAHLFFDLLEFLELPTLIITDLDTVSRSRSGKACAVSEGDGTSNACIKRWFPDPSISPSTLINKTPDEKTLGLRRIAYQIPEEDGGLCGRSLEAAFMLANPTLFNIDLNSLSAEANIYSESNAVKKTDFALEYALDKTDWIIPKYIKEGLLWLRRTTKGVDTEPTNAISLTNALDGAGNAE